MMFKFKLKKEENIDLAELHAPVISPKRDWRLALLVFFSVIGLTALFCAYLFVRVVNGDVYANQAKAMQIENVDEEKLDAALRFIQNKAAD